MSLAAFPPVDGTTLLLADVLRHPSHPAPPSGSRELAALIDAAARHRMLLPMGAAIRASGRLNAWPAEFVDAFQRAERAAATLEFLRQAELVTALDAVAGEGMRVMPFKGAAVAYTHYAAPHLRARCDTDLLVAAGDAQAIERVLAGIGYVRPPEASGRLVSYQSHHRKIGRHGVTHALDVHWKISNAQALANAISFEEMWAERVALPALGPAASVPSDLHALVAAIVHRAGHHPGSRDLLWIYDLHLLSGRLPAAEQLRACRVIEARGLSSVAREALDLTRWCFGTAAGEALIAGPVDGKRGRGPAPIAIRRPSRQADVLRADLRALPSWEARRQLIREHLFPPASYMRARYGVHSKFFLPAAYAWRALRGAPRWLRALDGERDGPARSA
jgi:hypothetical protein